MRDEPALLKWMIFSQKRVSALARVRLKLFFMWEFTTVGVGGTAVNVGSNFRESKSGCPEIHRLDKPSRLAYGTARIAEWYCF